MAVSAGTSYARKVRLRQEIVDRLGDGGSVPKSSRRCLRLWWKRTSWSAAILGTKAVKRLVDLGVSAVALIALLPVFVLVAWLIKCDDGGPVLFWQKRVGLWGREFDFPKFRSMRVDAEATRAELMDQNHHGGSVTFKMKNDPRVTGVGWWLRRLSIDELPQLWCVLKGEMSLVGPRPPVPREVACYSLRDRRRLDVTPGLTCIWQISGRGDISFDRQVQLDVQYVQSQSLWLDAVLIVKTIPAVLTGRGAY
jgi:lipopolysaccharide/colanic/teichoic acid biosynthesis glycosyltransferase